MAMKKPAAKKTAKTPAKKAPAKPAVPTKGGKPVFRT